VTADHDLGGRLLLTVEESSRRLSLSRTVVYELIRSGALRSVKVGASRRVPIGALQEYVEGLLAESDGSSGAS
jgi:excisionase family DNA binding protein